MGRGCRRTVREVSVPSRMPDEGKPGEHRDKRPEHDEVLDGRLTGAVPQTPRLQAASSASIRHVRMEHPPPSLSSATRQTSTHRFP